MSTLPSRVICKCVMFAEKVATCEKKGYMGMTRWDLRVTTVNATLLASPLSTTRGQILSQISPRYFFTKFLFFLHPRDFNSYLFCVGIRLFILLTCPPEIEESGLSCREDGVTFYLRYPNFL